MKAYEWTRSVCPICGRSYPHKVGYNSTICGNFNCLQEARQRGLLDFSARALGALSLVQLATARDKAEAAFRTMLKEDSQIADNMRDYWKCQNSGAEEWL